MGKNVKGTPLKKEGAKKEVAVAPATAAAQTSDVKTGQDGAFRMYVADRYYRMTQTKRWMRILFGAQIAVGLLRLSFNGLLYILPTNLHMSRFNAIVSPGMMALGFTGLYLIRKKASPGFMRQVGFMNSAQMLLVAQMVINFLRYFIAFFETSNEDRALAKGRRMYLRIGRAIVAKYGVAEEPLMSRLETFEGVMEICCIVVPLALVSMGNNLFSDLKDQRDEAIKQAEDAKRQAREINEAQREAKKDK